MEWEHSFPLAGDYSFQMFVLKRKQKSGLLTCTAAMGSGRRGFRCAGIRRPHTQNCARSWLWQGCVQENGIRPHSSQRAACWRWHHPQTATQIKRQHLTSLGLSMLFILPPKLTCLGSCIMRLSLTEVKIIKLLTPARRQSAKVGWIRRWLHSANWGGWVPHELAVVTVRHSETLFRGDREVGCGLESKAPELRQRRKLGQSRRDASFSNKGIFLKTPSTLTMGILKADDE